MANIITKSFNKPEESIIFLDGSKRSIVFLDSMVIGQGNYLPGWKWSLHTGSQTGKVSQTHIGYVISGQMKIKTFNGREFTVGPGEAFKVGPGHDAWVVGNEPCLALDFETLKDKKK